MAMMRTWVWACVAAMGLGSVVVGDGVVGWRTDGQGRYPEARAVMTWSAKEHVLWHRPTESWGNATTVIVGERMFICAEPTTLVCLNVADGKVLWERTNTYKDVLGEEGWAKVQEELKQGDGIEGQIQPLGKALGETGQQLKKLNEQMRKGATTRSAEETGQLQKSIGELKQKERELKGEIGELKKKLAAVSRYRLPSKQDNNGYSSPTPTSDGKHVWVIYGTGVAGCYDVEGNRKWIRLIEKPQNEWGHSASPLVIGEVLVVHIEQTVRGLDAATGQEIWKARSSQHWGSPQHACVGGLDVVVTAGGEIIRAKDGKVLAEKVMALEYNSPLVVGEVVYYIQTASKAVRLVADGEGNVKVEGLWTARLKKDRYYASPLLHEGLIYDLTQTGELSVVEAGTGAVVYEQKVDFGKSTVYSSPTLAGDMILLSNEAGTTVVVRPGRKFEIVGKNTLTAFRTCPVFVGDRMYVRALSGVYCVGE